MLVKNFCKMIFTSCAAIQSSSALIILTVEYMILFIALDLPSF